MPFGYPTNFFHSNEVMKKVSGIWLPGKEYHIVFRVLQIIYVLFFYSLGIIMSYGEYMALGDCVTQFGKLVGILWIPLTNIAGYIKIFVLTLGNKNLKRMMNALQDEKYHYDVEGESKPGNLLTKARNVNSVITFLLLVMYAFVGIGGNITTIINLNKELKENTFEFTNKTCNDFLSYDFKIPFHINTKMQCIAVSTCMYTGMALQAFFHATHDGLFVGLLICLKTQLLIIGDVLRTIRPRSLRNVNLPEDYQILHDENNPVLEGELYRQLTHCTKHLKILLRVRDEIEYLFSYVLLTQILASLFTYASCLYIATTVSMTSPDFYSKMEFFSCVLLQLSFMCWFGNEIRDASDSIKLSLYESDWFSCSSRFKKSMILTMIRMQQPVYLSIGKFSPLTLDTLVTVFRGSFSYFTVFKSAQ